MIPALPSLAGAGPIGGDTTSATSGPATSGASVGINSARSVNQSGGGISWNGNAAPGGVGQGMTSGASGMSPLMIGALVAGLAVAYFLYKRG